MEFVFDYEETLARRVTIEAHSFMDAIDILKNQIDNQELVLDSSDFISAEIKMPLEENYLPQVQIYGEKLKDERGFEIMVDFW